MTQRTMPTGECFCGCGGATPVGSYFLQGHDRRAESRVIEMVYDSVVGFLVQHGYGPGGKNVHLDYEAWEAGQQ
ncbi:MAG TPA: hypothetical protein VJA46_05785 [Acidimicrobiia bacterium]|nr:hypothetical protein [Acidimicrobiia bacterium]